MPKTLVENFLLGAGGCLLGVLVSRRILLVALFDLGWVCGRAGLRFQTAQNLVSRNLQIRESGGAGADTESDPRK